MIYLISRLFVYPVGYLLGIQKWLEWCEWHSLRGNYREQLIREVKGIKSCQDCIFEWWKGGDACDQCDGTPKDWGGSNEKHLDLAKRMLGYNKDKNNETEEKIL